MQVGFLNFYGSVLDVAQQRASLVANNIANADTPGFKAQDVSFDAAMSAELDPSPDPDALAAVGPSIGPIASWRWMATMSRPTMSDWRRPRMVSA